MLHVRCRSRALQQSPLLPSVLRMVCVHVLATLRRARSDLAVVGLALRSGAPASPGSPQGGILASRRAEAALGRGVRALCHICTDICWQEGLIFTWCIRSVNAPVKACSLIVNIAITLWTVCVSRMQYVVLVNGHANLLRSAAGLAAKGWRGAGQRRAGRAVMANARGRAAARVP